MKSLVVSDLHANEVALSAVMDHVANRGIERIICLGDFVGYGARPNEVLERMRTAEADLFYVRGNHDRVAAGLDQGDDFNQAARSAAHWTRDQLSLENSDFLVNLPLGPREDADGVLICHGSPADEDEYIFSEIEAARIFSEFESSVMFFGHTHLPVIFALTEDKVLFGNLIDQPGVVQLDRRRRYLINPGSVGQPRDRNPLSSFAIFDSEAFSIQFFRIPYDIAATQRAIIDAGLPKILADRLSYGF